MMGFGILIPLLIVIAIAYSLGWLPPNRRQASNQNGPARPTAQTPGEILKERYARGEITKTEYEEMRKDLAA